MVCGFALGSHRHKNAHSFHWWDLKNDKSARVRIIVRADAKRLLLEGRKGVVDTK